LRQNPVLSGLHRRSHFTRAFTIPANLCVLLAFGRRQTGNGMAL